MVDCILVLPQDYFVGKVTRGAPGKELNAIMVSNFHKDWRDIPHYCPGTGKCASVICIIEK